MLSDDLYRIAENLHARVGGPMTFRLVLQPIVAICLAVRDGVKDARKGRPAYFWAILTIPEHRLELLHEGWQAVLKVFVVAILIDAVYQWIELSFFYPGEALIVAVLLAMVPYILIRGPVNRIVRHFRDQREKPSLVN